MKIYSGLDKLIYLFCLALVFVLIGNTTDVYAQTPSLIARGDTGADKFYNVGDSISTTFIAVLSNAAQSGEVLAIKYYGLKDVTITNEILPRVTTTVNNRQVTATRARTDLFGSVKVEGRIIVPSDVYVKAAWISKQLEARAEYCPCVEDNNPLVTMNPQWSLPDGAIARLGKGSINEIEYSPDGSKLAVASSIGIWIYDAQTGEELNLLTGHTGLVTSVSFSPDGNTIASGSSDGTIRLWNANTGVHLRTLTGHTDYVFSVSFSPDGTTPRKWE